MASKRELQALILLAGKIDPSLTKALREADKKVGGLSKTTKLFGGVASKAFSLATKTIAAGVAGIGAGLLVVAKQGLDLASDLAEVQNVVDVTFGDGAKQIDAFAKSALKSYGLSELSAKQFSGTLGALMKSSGVSSKNLISMSENLTALSGDFASFYNLKPEEAFEKIKSGISGETEPLKALGINMSVANMEAFALSKGIKTSYAKMDQASQTMLRYNYLMAKSADAQNDFSRTIDSYANQQRLFKESFKQLSGTIMKAALPAFTSLFKKGNELISTFANSPDKIAKLQQAIQGIADKVVTFIPVVVANMQRFSIIVGNVIGKAVDLYYFISDHWSLIKPIIEGIVVAMAAWKIGSWIKTGVDGITAAYNFLKLAKEKDLLITAALKAMYLKDAIVKGTSTAATVAMTAATGAWNIAAGIGTVVTSAFGVAMAILTSPITLIILAIAALGAGIYLLIKYWDNVTGAMTRAWIWFKNLIAKIPNLALALTGPLAPILLLIKHFGELKDLAGKAFGAVKKFFGFGKKKGGGDDDPDLSDVPQYASGGFANRPSIFGEAGPEAAIPLKRTPRSLSLLNKTAQALGVGGGSERGGATFIFSPNYNGGSVTEREATQHFEDFKAICEEWWESKRRETFG